MDSSSLRHNSLSLFPEASRSISRDIGMGSLCDLYAVNVKVMDMMTERVLEHLGEGLFGAL